MLSLSLVATYSIFLLTKPFLLGSLGVRGGTMNIFSIPVELGELKHRLCAGVRVWCVCVQTAVAAQGKRKVFRHATCLFHRGNNVKRKQRCLLVCKLWTPGTHF